MRIMSCFSWKITEYGNEPRMRWPGFRCTGNRALDFFESSLMMRRSRPESGPRSMHSLDDTARRPPRSPVRPRTGFKSISISLANASTQARLEFFPRASGCGGGFGIGNAAFHLGGPFWIDFFGFIDRQAVRDPLAFTWRELTSFLEDLCGGAAHDRIVARFLFSLRQIPPRH